MLNVLLKSTNVYFKSTMQDILECPKFINLYLLEYMLRKKNKFNLSKYS